MSYFSYLRPVGALLLLFVLTACEGTGLDPSVTATGASNATPKVTSGSSKTTPTPASPTKPGAVSGTQLRLSAGDKVRVTVFGEEKLSGDYQLDTAGYLSLPLAGSMEAAGLTKPELEQAVTAKLKGEYLRNPKVTVDVIAYRPFYVLGEVKSPGEFAYRSGLNVLSAIAVAGGATYRANNATVLIQRSGTTEMIEYPQSPTIPVLPGDVVRVQERFF